MSIEIDFKEFGSPVQVWFGLANSANLKSWECSLEEAAALAGIDQLPWGRRPDDATAAVLKAGAMVRQKLAVVEQLQSALHDAFAAGANAARPLYFRTGKEPAVEAVPFEALWDEHLPGFACLEPFWPIARIPADVRPPAGAFAMERVVRVVAVVAAEGIDPTGQVDALLKGCVPPDGLAVELTVLTNSSAAVEKVENAGRPGWRGELVPATSEELILRLRSLQPHLLHVFCHGTANGPQLLVAQRDDLAVLELSADSFADLAKPWYVAPWLVTLNCCEGAAPGEQTVSLASGLVRTGLPAVVGMRKAIDAAMADAFCADLYDAVLARLAVLAGSGREARPLDWATVLREPRRRLSGMPHQKTAQWQKEWTMPVLYVASPTLRMRGRPTGDLSDAEVRTEQTAVAVADGLQDSANLPAEGADRLRDPALDRLYPRV